MSSSPVRSPASAARAALSAAKSAARARAILAARAARSSAAASRSPTVAARSPVASATTTRRLHVPEVAAQWIGQVLLLSVPVVETIRLDGLAVLKVDHLKRIWQALSQLEDDGMRAKRRSVGTPNGNKPVFMSRLRRYFYTDVACRLPDEALLTILQGRLTRPAAAAAAQPPAPPAEATPTFAEYLAQMTQDFRVAAETGIPPPPRAPFGFAGMPPPRPIAGGKKRKAPPGHLRAPPSDPETNPQTTREHQLLYALLAMGFTDKRQCLQIMRTCLQEETADAPCTPEVVMLRLVRLREDLAEASQMDAARLESERSRKAEARLRRETLKAQEEEALRAADLHVWRSRDFCHSWLLASDALRERLDMFLKCGGECSDDDCEEEVQLPAFKESLLQLFKLEKKARQWYGQKLPSAYFVRLVGPRLLLPGTCTTMEAALQGEIDKLELALYVLSAQTQGGVPRVFLEALNEFGDCNSTTEPSGGNDDAGAAADESDRPVVHVRAALQADGRTVVCID